jgi:hypothetical protein
MTERKLAEKIMTERKRFVQKHYNGERIKTMSKYRDLSAAGKELVDVHAGHSSLSDDDDDSEGEESTYSDTNVRSEAKKGESEKGEFDYLFDSSESETETVVKTQAGMLFGYLANQRRSFHLPFFSLYRCRSGNGGGEGVPRLCRAPERGVHGSRVA